MTTTTPPQKETATANIPKFTVNREEYVVARKELLNRSASSLDKVVTMMSRNAGSIKVLEEQEKSLGELKNVWMEHYQNHNHQSASMCSSLHSTLDISL